MAGKQLTRRSSATSQICAWQISQSENGHLMNGSANTTPPEAGGTKCMGGNRSSSATGVIKCALEMSMSVNT